jgi:hypothetical protein
MRWPESPGRGSRFGSSRFDIDWPYGEHQMMDGLIAAVGADTIDERARPGELAAKRARLRATMTSLPKDKLIGPPTG